MLPIIMSGYFPEGEVGRTRLNYASQAIQSIHSYAYMRNGHFEIFVAHDGPENENTRSFHEQHDWHSRVHLITSEIHSGIGASLNNALRILNPEVWMYTTDDFCLIHHLSLDKPLALVNAGYDYVRLLVHPDLECTTKFAINLGWFLELKTTNGYVVATRPFLMTKAMTYELAKYNKWAGHDEKPFIEGVTSYDVEIALNNAGKWLRDSSNVRPFAATLSDGEEWEHIGAVEVGHLAITA